MNTTQPSSARDWDEWLGLYASRDEMAQTYADWLRTEAPTSELWPILHAAILRRWSPAGLRYIKDKAWKIAGGCNQ